MKNGPKKVGVALSDKIYEKLYRRIVSGKLKSGQRITELQIAKSEGVSQAPVREALKRLAEERLVDLVPRSGCYIAKLTREDANYLFEIRKRLESLSLEYAFDKFDMQKVEKLREKFKKCLAIEQSKMVLQELKLDEQFHSLICESSGSRDLQVLTSKLWARIQLFRIREATDFCRARSALDSHIKILDAILAGNTKKARHLLVEHIESSRRYVLKTFVEED